MQEQKLESQSATAKKKLPSREKKCRECIYESSSQECLTGEATDFKDFLKKEAYTPEYSPGYAAQEKTD